MKPAASPLAKKLAKDNQLDLASIKGSGPQGRIVKRDIEAALKATPAAPNASTLFPDPRLFYKKDTYREIPLTRIQATIAKRMALAMQTIPHFYVSMKYDMRDLLSMRHSANEVMARREGLKLTINDFIVRAVALALMDVPAVNVSFADDCLLQHQHADIGVAVALKDGGLITPIVSRAEKKSVLQIATDIRDLAARAAIKKLKPHEYEGGSFSVSNLGMFGVSHFTAIINPPQAAILAIGAVDENAQLEATLSCDHRAIHGALAARFLQTLGEIMEAPHQLWLR